MGTDSQRRLTDDELNAVVMTALRAPFVGWQDQLKSLSQQDLLEVNRRADEIAVRAARLGTYALALSWGDSHEDAVKIQNNLANRIRRVLGFTYPRDITF